MDRLSHKIETDVFYTGSAPHSKLAAEKIVSQWWWAIVIPFSITTIYGIVADARWLIISIAILLLFIPTLILIGYLGAISDPDAVTAMFHRKASFMPDGTIIVKAIKVVKGEDDYELRLPETLTIHSERIESVTFLGKYLHIHFDNASRNLLIPVSAFREPESPVILERAFGNHEVNS